MLRDVVRWSDCEQTLTVKVYLDSTNPTWSWEFAFRTHRSDQALFSLRTDSSESIQIRLERDFFLRIGSEKPSPVSQLSDGQWHTITLTSEAGDVYLTVDDLEKIPVAEVRAYGLRLSAVEIEVDGEILLIDPSDTSENCELNDRRKAVGQSQFMQACSGCQCTILNGIFDGFPAPSCAHNGEEAYRLLRDPDRLSFFYIPVSADTQHLKPLTRIGLSYKSEMDIGLLLFGFWQEEETKGRFQVYYKDRHLIGIYCENQGEEVCRGCSLSRIEGFGNDEWTRVAFFEAYGELSLVADKAVCTLSELGSTNNLSLAEVYSIPVLATESAIFVGGTFYEKKKPGVYLPNFEHKYFENTREKVPSLRGCLKDIFVDGKLTDLSSIHSQQMEHTLIDSGDETAYAIQIDGVNHEIPDVSKYVLNNITLRASEDSENFVVIHVSASWVIYSLVLTTVLCLLLTVCLLIYCCILRSQRRRGSESSDRDRILRDSPDYSVKLRSNRTESESSYDGDGSIGTDDTDLNAYRDIPSHRVKIYRESMVSILVPGVDQPNEAIVKRMSSTERVASTPLLPPSPAPLVRVDDQ
ncbi:hypothetical protein NECAME_06634 [Necator americanus]|uniref:Laminin G domain protein n=1 Tax=Necator americanus TaxID=51031 RepID=W2TTC0_NECAM|nr:hypothetical protein NECAME_06634 [Necator americanus]ETN84909.1 hypothetical protein NECAME_06634 [Necator americanus]